MPITIDIEKDFLYRRGHKKGIEKGIDLGKEQNTINVILTGHKKGLAPEMLAEITGWTTDRVLSVLRRHGVM